MCRFTRVKIAAFSSVSVISLAASATTVTVNSFANAPAAGVW